MVNTRTASACLVFAVLFSIAPIESRADFQSEYWLGRDALVRGQWSEAIEHLRMAIAQNAKEGSTIPRYGAQHLYLPYYYLGLAYSKDGDCASAVRAWEESKRQGANSEPGFESQLVKEKLGCAPLSSAGRAVSDLSTVQTRVPPREQGKAPPRQATESSQDSASTPAKQDEFEPPMLPFVLLPTNLVTGVTAYFNGDYERAAELLDGLSSSDQRIDLQIRLFRAASNFALYVIGGSRNTQLREKAELDARRVSWINASFAPAPSDFSPRFVEFYLNSKELK